MRARGAPCTGEAHGGPPCARALGRAVEELQLAAGAEVLAPELRAALLAALVEVARLAGVAEWLAEDLVAAGLSMRAAGRQLGVKHTTVRLDLQRSTGSAEPVERPKAKGLDSKSYPAAKPAPEQVAARAERSEPRSIRTPARPARAARPRRSPAS